MHACMTLMLLASQGHSGMIPMTGVLQWKDTGFSGRTDKADDETVFALYVNVQWVCMKLCLVRDESTKSLRVRIKERAGTGDISVSASCKLFHQGAQVKDSVFA